MKRIRKVSDIEQMDDAIDWTIRTLKEWLQCGAAQITISEPVRKLTQNDKLWPMLRDLSQQVVWHGKKLSTDDWKHLLTGSFRSQIPLPGISGGVVFLGMSTSKMRVSEFAELIEFAYSVGADHDVVWSETSQELIDEANRKLARVKAS